MNCEKCGRPLKDNEKKLCPNCKNEQDKSIKTGVKIGGGVLAGLVVIGTTLLKIFGGSKNGKS
jgi:ABC-type ATPase with predicted acetyltransferase domain